MAQVFTTVVVRTLKKQTHLSVFDTNPGTLAVGLSVAATGSDGTTYKGHVKKVNPGRTIATIRLKCTKKRSAKSGADTGDNPDTGTLSITITGGPMVDDTSVTFVDDADGCEPTDE